MRTIGKGILNLDKTRVMVYFSLYGDELPTDKVTQRLEITPTKTYKKGNLIPNYEFDIDLHANPYESDFEN